jgi:hypothetical protein
LIGFTVHLCGLLNYIFAGTPIVNKLEDLYSLLCVSPENYWILSRFTVDSENSSTSRLGRVTHSSDRRLTYYITNCFTRTSLSRFITLPFLDRDPKAIEIVQVILESVLLRREKNMRDSDGKKIVELPAKEVSLVS